MSSELLNALNPNIVSSRRPRPSIANVPESSTVAAPVVQRPFVPHRSELEYAIAEPPPRAPPPTPAQVTTPAPRPVSPLQEVLRELSAARDADEAERQRRIAWEKEQEERYAQRQAELERQMLEMRQELTVLKNFIYSQPTPSPGAPPSIPSALRTPARSPQQLPFEQTVPNMLTPQTAHASASSLANHSPIALPLSPVTPESSPQLGTPSIQSVLSPHVARRPNPMQRQHVNGPTPQGPPTPALSTPRTAMTPQSSFESLVQRTPAVEGSPQRVASPPAADNRSRPPSNPPRVYGDIVAAPVPPSHAVRVKDSIAGPSTVVSPPRKRPIASSANDDGVSSDDDFESEGRAFKRISGVDGRCRTIQHAMRLHLIRMMQIPDDKHLPESHVEGRQLSANDPIRFVWDKTIRQSAHNSAMRRRIIEDMRANRSVYKFVPEQDFEKKHLESVFDQAFTTLRQKAHAQMNTALAEKHKRREEQKSMKARRTSRKKMKLASRVEMRKKMSSFSHATFDGALQQDCMSSEESGEEDGEPSPFDGSIQKVEVLRIRGLPWRSLRLQCFYSALDEEDQVDKSKKPKRGSGPKERRIGQYKDGDVLPPEGVASWMISKRWLRLLQLARPDRAVYVRSRIFDPPGFDCNSCPSLGAESEDDMELSEVALPNQYIPFSDTSYSLQYALTPQH